MGKVGKRMLKTFENKNHIDILNELKKNPSNSNRLKNTIKLSQGSIYNHLMNLKKLGYVEKIDNNLYQVTDKYKKELQNEIERLNNLIYDKTKEEREKIEYLLM